MKHVTSPLALQPYHIILTPTGSSTPYGSRSVASTPAGATPTRHTPPGAAAAPAAAGSTQPTPAAASSEESSRDSSFSFRDRPTGLGGGTAAGGGGNAGGGSPASGAARANGAGGAGEAAGPRSRFAAEAEKLTIGLTVTDDMDLNKVSSRQGIAQRPFDPDGEGREPARLGDAGALRGRRGGELPSLPVIGRKRGLQEP